MCTIAKSCVILGSQPPVKEFLQVLHDAGCERLALLAQGVVGQQPVALQHFVRQRRGQRRTAPSPVCEPVRDRAPFVCSMNALTLAATRYNAFQDSTRNP